MPPGVVTPDDRANESDWQKAAAPDMKNAIKPVAYFSIVELIVA